MSLYYDAATILTSGDGSGSLKSLIYAKNANLRSKPAHVYALISETSKYDIFLKEVIDNADILHLEPKLTPLLSLLITHDHFFSKHGISAATSHPLRQAIEKHKARLQSEFIRARLRRKAANVEQLKAQLQADNVRTRRTSPRWARLNTLKVSFDDFRTHYLQDFEEVDELKLVLAAPKDERLFHIDRHIPNLLAFPPDHDLTKTPAYAQGHLILQDKASCFPAYLLVGHEAQHENFKDSIDGCAAPGNKTTHLAAILRYIGSSGKVYACERDPVRSKTLQTMVNKAGGGDIVFVLGKQDFLALDPQKPCFASVTHILLDPSCSGSGILGREDIPKLALPQTFRSTQSQSDNQKQTNSKKRKHQEDESTTLPEDSGELNANSEAQPIRTDALRLEKLSNLQSMIVEHAFTFPAARQITYSTCSIHIEENEAVVQKVLRSKAAQTSGWRVLRRDEQVEGMKQWKHRGAITGHGLTTEQNEACIRCTPHDDEGTMGFFVCGFVREWEEEADRSVGRICVHGEDAPEDDWSGFDD